MHRNVSDTSIRFFDYTSYFSIKQVLYSIVRDCDIASKAIGTTTTALFNTKFDSAVWSYAGGIAGSATNGSVIEYCMHIQSVVGKKLEATYEHKKGTNNFREKDKATGSIVGNGADKKEDLTIKYSLYKKDTYYTGEKYLGAGKCDNQDLLESTFLNISNSFNQAFSKVDGWMLDIYGYPQLVLPRAGG